HETLNKLGQFIEHDLDYDRIVRAGIGSVSSPNTSFGSDAAPQGFNPVGRWKKAYTPEQLAKFEVLVGKTLKGLGYPLQTENPELANTLNLQKMHLLYPLL